MEADDADVSVGRAIHFDCGRCSLRTTYEPQTLYPTEVNLNSLNRTEQRESTDEALEVVAALLVKVEVVGVDLGGGEALLRRRFLNSLASFSDSRWSVWV